MKMALKTFGLIVIGATVSIVMLGLAAILMIPLVIAATGLSLVLQGPTRAALSRMMRRDESPDVLEGDRVVLDLRHKDKNDGQPPP